jgi:hypothetical protein
MRLLAIVQMRVCDRVGRLVIVEEVVIGGAGPYLADGRGSTQTANSRYVVICSWSAPWVRLGTAKMKAPTWQVLLRLPDIDDLAGHLDLLVRAVRRQEMVLIGASPTLQRHHIQVV